ncbi:MAG TPA: DEAD/DEAH box helicase [Chloroflexia bacterium]|nr:DEAD/DEAH box helicase [Chloroflexia bacterium]
MDTLPTLTLVLAANDLLLIPPQGTTPEELRAALHRTGWQGRTVLDSRRHGLRALPLDYTAICEALGTCYNLKPLFELRPALPHTVEVRQQPRPYQRDAIEAWRAAGHRGVVVLPTGAGKTLVALLSIAELNTQALICVPTLDLLGQWKASILSNTNLAPEEVGTWGGGDKELRPVTVITYDSAAIHMRSIQGFGLLVFDEVHHLPADTYRTIAEGSIATARLGLSATPDRSDLRHTDLDRLVGPVVYERSPFQLREGKHIADYRTEQISVALTGDERTAYERAAEVYRAYLRKNRISMRSGSDYERFLIWRSGNDHAARDALLAHQAARKIALSASGKLQVVAGLLARHADDRVLVFSEYNALVDEIGKRFCIPTVTHKTPPAERKAVLEGFRSGRFSKLATGRVLNEGVDLPDANVAIILSGSATKREFIQRLGRVLRPKADEAVLYEVVTEETTEENISRRRQG